VTKPSGTATSTGAAGTKSSSNIFGRTCSDQGRLEAVDARTSRLTGSTGNPYWYAEQLAALPAPFRAASAPRTVDKDV
jgi:hypothetical protein